MIANGKIRKLAIICLLAFFGVLDGRATESEYSDPTAGFSMKLPEGWNPTRGEAARELAGLRAKLEPAMPGFEVPVVFLKANQGNISSSFPKIVVHVQPDAEVGYKQFQSIHAFRGAVERNVARALSFRNEQGVLTLATTIPIGTLCRSPSLAPTGM